MQQASMLNVYITVAEDLKCKWIAITLHAFADCFVCKRASGTMPLSNFNGWVAEEADTCTFGRVLFPGSIITQSSVLGTLASC